MGGMAYLIYGDLDEARLTPPSDRSLLDRLLRRKAGVRISDFGRGEKLWEVPAKELQILRKMFRQFVSDRIPSPWPATQVFLDYLAVDVSEIYLRGDHGAEADRPSEWYLQFNYSGCAGLAEVSAELATHWTGIWWEEARKTLEDEVLNPFGFRPSEKKDPSDRAPLFFPLPEGGYAGHWPQTADQPQIEYGGFDVDGAVLEGQEDPEAFLRGLEEALRPLAQEGRCRCQMCMPDAIL